ncbi:hypothetical protein FA13DRAFT_1587498, partial [Coprinellus micaceus]
MKVEWAKARAWKLRWDEEFRILLEEMQRMVVYLRWKANWWLSQAGHHTRSIDPTVLVGVRAYAHKQAAMLECLATSSVDTWTPVL